MTKTFCDRCGKEILPRKYAWIRHQSIYAKLTLEGCAEGLRDKDMYVCPECEKSFIQWFINGGRTKDDNNCV